MSYDLVARSDEEYSDSIPRSAIASAASQVPGMEPNGPTGFLLERGGDVWMEVDIELVNSEGDNIEESGSAIPDVANCINFHVPYSFIDSLDSHIEIAIRMAGAVGWQLYDPQSDEVIDGRRRRKPWWRFW